MFSDDLDISPDFFDYFLATYPVLHTDPSLWCVSAWNDNGKADLVSDESGLSSLYELTAVVYIWVLVFSPLLFPFTDVVMHLLPSENRCTINFAMITYFFVSKQLLS